MLQFFKTSRWLKLGLALIVPLLLYAVLAERASWRPHTIKCPGDVVGVAYSPNGRWLACLSMAYLDIRDVHTQQLVWQQLSNSDSSSAVEFSPDSRSLVLSNNSSLDTSLKVWNTQTHKFQRDLYARYSGPKDAQTLLFTPDSAHLITSGYDESQLFLWDLRQGRLQRILGTPKPDINKACVAQALSADGRKLAVGTVGKNGTYAQLWSLATGQILHTFFPPPHNSIGCVAFTSDQKTLVAGTDNGAMLFWDIATRRLIRQVRVHSVGGVGLTMSHDGQLIATSDRSHEVKLWDVRRGTLLRILPHHWRSINGLAFAPDSATLAIAGDQAIQLWRIK